MYALNELVEIQCRCMRKFTETKLPLINGSVSIYKSFRIFDTSETLLIASFTPRIYLLVKLFSFYTKRVSSMV